jgi:hypothetical protein
MLLMAGIAAGAGMSVVLVGLLFSRRRVLNEPLRDVLILAAHQDDCVIMAGEYAIEAAKAGREVRVVYLTCGDREVGSERARKRMQEAIAAWKGVGVEETKLECLGLVNSSMGGPSLVKAEELEAARLRLAQITRAAPREAAVIIPAAGEAHHDHRMLRRVALEALRNSGRTDLMLLETPEYNAYYSLWHSPLRGLAYLGRCVPVMGRFVGGRAYNSAGFVHGGAGFVLRPDAQRQQRRNEMLAAFESEDPQKLIRLFGEPATFRLCEIEAGEEEGPRGYVRVAGNWLGGSVIVALLAMSCTLFAAMYVAAALARRVGYHELLIRVLLVGVAAFVLAWTAFKGGGVERRGLAWAAAAGLAAGALGPTT